MLPDQNRSANTSICLSQLRRGCQGVNGAFHLFSTQPLRRNTHNYKRGKKNGAKESCQTKRQEYVTLNEANKHDCEPERRKSEPEVKRENFLPWTAGQKEPIPLSE